MSTAASTLAERLGLSDDELLAVLGAAPLDVVSGALDHAPQLPLLLAITEEVAASLAPGTLPRWLRTAGPAGRPVDLLLAQDFGAFEDAVETLRERGFVIGG